MSKIFICGRKFEYDGILFQPSAMSIIFTKLSPQKSSVFAVFRPQEALTGIFPARFQQKDVASGRRHTPGRASRGVLKQRFSSLFDCRFRSKTRPFACRKALPRAQRGPYGRPTGPLRQGHSSPTARQRKSHDS